MEFVCIIVSMPQPYMVEMQWHDASFIGASPNMNHFVPPGYKIVSIEQFRSTIRTPDGRMVSFGFEPKKINCDAPTQCEGKCEPTS